MSTSASRTDSSGKTILRAAVTIGVPVLLIASSSLLALQPELRLALPLLLGTTAAMASLLAFSLYCGERLRLSWSPPVILSVALFLRLLFLFSPPQLSDDIYRYLWDGSNLLAGVNPYGAAPSAMTPSAGLKTVHSLINHPECVTIYPPAAQILFAAGAVGGTVTLLKAFLVFLDLALCALLVAALKQLDMPAWRAVLYAWNPLPLLEIAGSGHVDGAGLTLLLASLYLLLAERRRAAWLPPRPWPVPLSGALLACASLVKLFPLALVPLILLLVSPRRRLSFCAGFLAALAALILPFLPQLANALATLDLYARNWEFAGFAFNALRTLTGSGALARFILGSLFLLLTAVATLRLALVTRRPGSAAPGSGKVLEGCYALSFAFLLLTPTLQPWYALCLAAFLPFCAAPGGLVFCWVVFLTYRVQIPYFILGKWIESPRITAAVFLAPVTALLVGAYARRR